MSAAKRLPLPAITGVRFFLALWVIALHMTVANVAFKGLVGRSPALIREVIQAGASAVGIFFLLSGFVLAYNYDLGRKWDSSQRWRFWTARFARIYPVYCLALVVAIPSLVAGTVKAGPLHPGSLAVGAGAVLLLVQAWIPNDAEFWGGPAWSLSVEAFFYLCFPFLGRLLWKVERRGLQWITLAGLWLTACGVSYWIAEWKAPWFLHAADYDTVWSLVIKFNPAIRLPEFLAGVMLCKIFVSYGQEKTLPSRFGRGTFLCLFGLAAGLGVLSQDYRLPPAVLHDGLLLPATAAVILGLSRGGGWIGRWLSLPTIVLLGQVSYAMYLLHMPLYSYFAAANKRVVHNQAEAWMSFILFLGCLITACCVTFFWLEEPSRKAVLRKLHGEKPFRRSKPELPEPVAADPF